MKTTVSHHPQTQPPVLDFTPGSLVIDPKDGQVILVTSGDPYDGDCFCGVVLVVGGLSDDGYFLGESDARWPKSDFQPYIGTVTLQSEP